MNPDNNSEDMHIVNPLHAHQTGEQTLFEIKRHPLGIFAIYFVVAFALSAIAVLSFAIMPSVLSSYDKSQIHYFGTLVLLVSAFFGVCIALVSHIVYWGNRWVVTSDSITQIQQTGLFTKHASQLSLENLEDVTSEKNGALTFMLNYGVLKAETAGERSKFMFIYCPDPEKYAREILNARERFMLDVREKEDQRLKDAILSQQSQASPPPQATP